MKRSTREWVRKAEGDHGLAEGIHRGNEGFHDQLCFHCQQSAEKYLKAILEELGVSIPKTHDLDEILDLLLPYHVSLRPLRRGLVFLSNFAVAGRYPGFTVRKRQAVAAFRWGGRVREGCRAILGVSGCGRSKRP